MKLLHDLPEKDGGAVLDFVFPALDKVDENRPGRASTEVGQEKKLRLKELEDEEAKKQRSLEKRRQDWLLREAEETLRKSVARSSQILEEARKQGDKLKEEARTQGYEEGLLKGQKEGEEKALAEGRAVWKKETDAFQDQIASYVREMDYARDKVVEKYLDDLKDISLAVAEKIIRISLKDSADVTKRMILAATEKLKKKAWVKIYVGKGSQERKLNGDRELLDELSRISDNVKIVMMEDAEAGTCIVEMPDEIIDASVSTQMENIRDILNNARL